MKKISFSFCLLIIFQIINFQIINLNVSKADTDGDFFLRISPPTRNTAHQQGFKVSWTRKVLNTTVIVRIKRHYRDEFRYYHYTIHNDSNGVGRDYQYYVKIRGREEWLEVYRVNGYVTNIDENVHTTISNRKLSCHLRDDDTYSCNSSVSSYRPETPSQPFPPVQPDTSPIETIDDDLITDININTDVHIIDPVLVQHSSFYFPERDVVRVDYYNAPTETVRYKLVNFMDNGSYYERWYDYEPTGIHYLTCNISNYAIEFFNSDMVKIGYTNTIYVNELQNPTCNSYAGETIVNDLGLVQNGNVATWNDVADSYDIYKDGEYHETVYENRANFDDNHSYTVVARDSSGNTIGESDFNTHDLYGGSSSCSGCGLIRDMLSCPEWNEYMGEWSDMIKNSFPDPPYWQGVADIMRDTIVPAMGQEIVDRMPEIAEIIADEFQSREKPVAPPTPLETYETPDGMPEIPDLENQIEIDINENVPDFTPDFSESSPFTIPDPTDFEFWDEDYEEGYNMPEKGIENEKDFSGTPVIIDDHGYESNQPDGISAPEYNTPPDNVGETPPSYQHPEMEDQPSYDLPGNAPPDDAEYDMPKQDMPDYIYSP